MFSVESIIFNTFFAIFSAGLGVVLGKIFSDPSDICKSNSTEIYIIREYIDQRKVYYKSQEVHNSNDYNTSNDSSYSTGDIIFILILVGALIIGFYTKYYNVTQTSHIDFSYAP